MCCWFWHFSICYFYQQHQHPNIEKRKVVASVNLWLFPLFHSECLFFCGVKQKNDCFIDLEWCKNKNKKTEQLKKQKKNLLWLWVKLVLFSQDNQNKKKKNKDKFNQICFCFFFLQPKWESETEWARRTTIYKWREFWLAFTTLNPVFFSVIFSVIGNLVCWVRSWSFSVTIMAANFLNLINSDFSCWNCVRSCCTKWQAVAWHWNQIVEARVKKNRHQRQNKRPLCHKFVAVMLPFWSLFHLANNWLFQLPFFDFSMYFEALSSSAFLLWLLSACHSLEVAVQ